MVVPETTSTPQPDAMAEQVLEEKEKEADAAAEALLAELEEAAKTKKSRKKKKKERLQQKTRKKDDEPSKSIPALVQGNSHFEHTSKQAKLHLQILLLILFESEMAISLFLSFLLYLW